MWYRVGGVGARSRKRAGLGYRLVRKHARSEILGLLISKFLGLEYMSIRDNGQWTQLVNDVQYKNCIYYP